MTRGPEKAAAFFFLALGIIGVIVSKRPGTDIAAGVLGGLGFLFFMTPSLRHWRDDRRSRGRDAARRRTPWAEFMEPAPLNGRSVWKIGIRRKTEDGEVIDTDEENDELIEMGDSIGRIEATGRAEMRAHEYNEQKVRM